MINWHIYNYISLFSSTPYENVILFNKVHFIYNRGMEYLLIIFSLIYITTAHSIHQLLKMTKLLSVTACLLTVSKYKWNIIIIHCEWFHEFKVISYTNFEYSQLSLYKQHLLYKYSGFDVLFYYYIYFWSGGKYEVHIHSYSQYHVYSWLAI